MAVGERVAWKKLSDGKICTHTYVNVATQTKLLRKKGNPSNWLNSQHGVRARLARPFFSSLSVRTYFTICFARQCGMSIVTRLHEYSAGLWADLWATTQGWSKTRKKTTTTRTKSKARSWKHKRMYEWMFAHLPTCRNNHQCHARRLERGYTHARAHPHTHTQAHSSSHSAARFACSYHCTLIHSFLVINLPNSTPSSPSSTHAA